jgi:hypothetical protein
MRGDRGRRQEPAATQELAAESFRPRRPGDGIYDLLFCFCRKRIRLINKEGCLSDKFEIPPVGIAFQ